MRVGTAGCADDRIDLFVFEQRVHVLELSFVSRWPLDVLAEPNLEAVPLELRRPTCQSPGHARSDAGGWPDDADGVSWTESRWSRKLAHTLINLTASGSYKPVLNVVAVSNSCEYMIGSTEYDRSALGGSVASLTIVLERIPTPVATNQ